MYPYVCFRTNVEGKFASFTALENLSTESSDEYKYVPF